LLPFSGHPRRPAIPAARAAQKLCTLCSSPERNAAPAQRDVLLGIGQPAARFAPRLRG